MARKRSPQVETLDMALKRRAAPAAAELAERLDGYRVRCLSCGLRCRIPDGRDGICKVRFNRRGTLFAPRGYVAGLQVDPIEKKPFFHAFPGADALSFGMLGCDLHCPFCQNWLSSQALREDAAGAPPRDISADDIVSLAVRHGAPAAVSTYNEPLITAEWSVEIFELAREQGITCGYVSNGSATPQVLEYLRPYVDLFKVDLKGFRKETYRKCGGKLEAVLDSIGLLHELGFWVEIVTLLVPGLNDSREELEELTGFIASVSPDIPWHVTAFHPDFKMTSQRGTAVEDLVRASSIGDAAGLRYVYAGNLPGRVGALENTQCPGCGDTLIERSGFRVLRNALTDEGCCPSCGTAVPGFWNREAVVPAVTSRSAPRREPPAPGD